MKINLLLLVAVLSVLFAIPQTSAIDQYIYKWKDQEGMIHYTERPPEAGIAFEKVRRSNDKGEKNTPTAPAKPATEQASAEKNDGFSTWKQENCKIATQNLDMLNNADRVKSPIENRLMTDEEKAAEIKRMTDQRDKYCEQEVSDSN